MDGMVFPVVIMQSRFNVIRLALSSVVGLAVGVWVCFSGSPDTLNWGALCVLVSLVSLMVYSVQPLRPGRLVVDSHGTTQRALLRNRMLPWREVANFRVWRQRCNVFVAFDDLRAPGVRRILRAFRRSVSAQATLAPGWSMEAGRLAALLNAARSHWIGPARPRQ